MYTCLFLLKKKSLKCHIKLDELSKQFDCFFLNTMNKKFRRRFRYSSVTKTFLIILSYFHYLPSALLLVYNLNINGPTSSFFRQHGIITYRPLNSLQVPNILLPFIISEEIMCSPGMCILYILFSSTCGIEYFLMKMFYDHVSKPAF